MEYNNHQQQNITELPTATHQSCDKDETIQTKSPSPTSSSLPSSLPSSSPSHHDRVISENNNHDHDINQKEKTNNNVEVGSYDHQTLQAHECVVEIRETIGRSTSGEVSNNGVDDDDDIHSVDEYSLSPRKKRCVQIAWYVVIGAFLTAFPMFAAGIVLGIIAYSDRPRAHLLRKPANIVLSVFFFLVGVGATFLIFHYVRKRVGFWTKKREHEMVTEFSNALHDEPSVVSI